MKKKILTINNLEKAFGTEKVLKDINLNLYQGDILGIVGRNGCGKTVLLKLIAGLYHPDSGVIEYGSGINPLDNCGFLIETGFLDNETGFNNLAMLASLKNKINKYDIYKVMEEVGLNPNLKTKYKNYSTGMK